MNKHCTGKEKNEVNTTRVHKFNCHNWLDPCSSEAGDDYICQALYIQFNLQVLHINKSGVKSCQEFFIKYNPSRKKWLLWSRLKASPVCWAARKTGRSLLKLGATEQEVWSHTVKNSVLQGFSSRSSGVHLCECSGLWVGRPFNHSLVENRMN